MGYAAKRAIVRCMHVVTWPCAQAARMAHVWWGSEATFDFWAKLLSLVPGRIGQLVRASFYVQTLAGCSHDLSMAFGSFFSHPTARVGQAVSIGAYCIIGTAEVGDGVMIASRVSILSGKRHHGSPLFDRALVDDPSYEMVRIGSGSWIGEGAVVMASLGERCTVGAGSVVTRAAPVGSIAIGNPARFLRPQGESDATG